MLNQTWETWKKGFARWEKTTAEYLEKVLENPMVLGGAGSLLSASMKTKTAGDEALARWWGTLGLPTKRDQERGLHKLNTLESRLFDLEEELAELKAAAGREQDTARGSRES